MIPSAFNSVTAIRAGADENVEFQALYANYPTGHIDLAKCNSSKILHLSSPPLRVRGLPIRLMPVPTDATSSPALSWHSIQPGHLSIFCIDEPFAFRVGANSNATLTPYTPPNKLPVHTRSIAIYSSSHKSITPQTRLLVMHLDASLPMPNPTPPIHTHHELRPALDNRCVSSTHLTPRSTRPTLRTNANALTPSADCGVGGKGKTCSPLRGWGGFAFALFCLTPWALGVRR
ncbi:hypothetical protein P154DRAFT_105219 [Amniculicola lignicola CBS 123094]|uniref:Uncharacterized protein n=1 Tax=Amniculicola lignicola CBS 123094 TaxID=1392246 RepID=A0A6A5VUL2_9PLEO|nr:hypothetical protein P154DRAFT_105219 [Amniculicola lignicola CBS 123094]